MGLIVPTEVEAIFHGADDPAMRLDENQISADLMRVRKNLPTTSADQQRGAFAEIAAWHFTRSDDGDAEPWGLYWGPVASGVLADGKTSFYSPNVAELDDDILAYWIDRASSAKHPAISARYADLAWTIGGYLRRPQERRPECMAPLASIDVPVSLAHGAIDNYLDTVERDLAKDEYHAWFYLARAVELVVSLKDPVRIGRAKSVLFGYHGKLVGAQERFMWWRVDDIVTRFEKVLNLDASETSALQGTLRKALDESSDATNEEAFDPHKATAAADRLIKRLGTNKVEIQAAIKQAGEAFEKAAENAKGLLAVSWLEDLIPRYRDVGLNADAVRIEQTIRARSEEAMSEMKHISVPLNIPEKEIHDWADKIAGSSLTEALGRIAVAGMTKEETIRQSVNASRDHAPLASQIAVVIMSHDGFTEATIGSVEDDIEGRSFKEAADRFNFEAPFLYVLFNRIREKHGLDIEQLLDHVRKSPFFPAHREPLLRDGLAAWFDDDPVKAIHLLVPQIEAACRDLLASAGVSVRKPNPRVSGSRVIGLGDVLGSKVFKQGGMKDVGFHLRALYTDPRGINLRNKLAHGLAHGGILGMGVANLVVHSILMIAALSIKHKQP